MKYKAATNLTQSFRVVPHLRVDQAWREMFRVGWADWERFSVANTQRQTNRLVWSLISEPIICTNNIKRSAYLKADQAWREMFWSEWAKREIFFVCSTMIVSVIGLPLNLKVHPSAAPTEKFSQGAHPDLNFSRQAWSVFSNGEAFLCCW